jgi:hypothetical protein
MNSPDDYLCPIPDMGYCIYDGCPYWDASRQECDADCLKPGESSRSQPAEGPRAGAGTEEVD